MIEDELTCPICNGTGEDELYVCEKCDGSGKVDWVSNAITRNKKRTILERIDVKKVISSIKEIGFSEDFANINIFDKKMKNHLESLQVNKSIVDYNVRSNWLSKCIDVSIKPVQSVEQITLNFTIN